MRANDWHNKTTGSNEPNKMPATAALNQLKQTEQTHPSFAVGMDQRSSLDSAMAMQLRTRFGTTDLFGSLSAGDGVAFPEIKWCYADESENAMRKLPDSNSQLHQQHKGATGHILGGGFQKTQTWPRRSES